MGETYKSIDLFAGIGGIRLGFENAFGSEISTVFVSEWDLNAQKTYSANFTTPVDDEGKIQIYGDITKSETKDAIPSFDICLAGFPCQAFSMAGRHMGFSAPPSVAFLYAIPFIAAILVMLIIAKKLSDKG